MPSARKKKSPARTAKARGASPAAARGGRIAKVIGESDAMSDLLAVGSRLSESDVPVIIEGETGTGKELFAASIHQASPRAKKPFVVIDAGSLTAATAESELFGHSPSASKGPSDVAVLGAFQRADGGTLVLDEVSELEPELQGKLLRVLERGEVNPVGAHTKIPVNVRVIATSRVSLEAEMRAGRFRDDLFFRLAVANVTVPPLRDRHADVALLVRHFWRRLSGKRSAPPKDLLAGLESHNWPGNVRELENIIARRVALGDLAGGKTSVNPGSTPYTAKSDSGRDLRGSPADGSIDRLLSQELPLAQARQELLRDFEGRYIRDALDRHGGDVEAASRAAGVSRRYFERLCSRLNP
jgi:DNA-binding NtrC family response regulator